MRVLQASSLCHPNCWACWRLPALHISQTAQHVLLGVILVLWEGCPERRGSSLEFCPSTQCRGCGAYVCTAEPKHGPKRVEVPGSVCHDDSLDVNVGGPHEKQSLADKRAVSHAPCPCSQQIIHIIICQGHLFVLHIVTVATVECIIAIHRTLV